ncbi:SRPBCC family protein [Verrucosispora sp. TAA-831]|uniref:SRPBCC family protein n=1 Tax=Verrucosispora sp. TAA-831 TaxID=3422227 RepID=UPI003D6FC290
MKLNNDFVVNIPIDRAWAVLTDLEGIAPCMPGARLTGVEGDVHKGKVKVKVGPVVSEFAGTAQFVEKDDAAYRAVIDAKGRDARSAANAAAVVTAALRPDGDRTLVSVDTDLRISGKLAQFGSGMIKEVSGKLLAQFVTNLEAKLAAEEAATVPAATEAPSAAAPATVDAVPVAADAAPASATSRPAPAPTGAAAATAAPAAGETVTAGAHPNSVDLTPAAATVSTEATAGGGDPLQAATAAPAAGTTSTGDATTTRQTVIAEPASVPTDPVTRGAAAPARADDDDEALDLLSIAGGSITKRVVPLVVGLVVVGAVIAWLIARR